MRGVNKRFGPTIALKGVDLDVYPGEVLALIGENGAGKSTLMKILSGAQLPDEGSIALFDRGYHPASPLDGRRNGIAMIYQELSLAPHLSVEENLLLGIEPVMGPLLRLAERKRKAQKALDELGVRDVGLNDRAGSLSPARQQMVEIARGIAAGCRILILDEPTSSLPREDIERLFSLIRDLKSRGLAIIYISHFLEEVKQITDRYAVLRDGSPAGTGNTADVSISDLAALMVGRKVEEMYPRSTRRRGEIVLRLLHAAGRKPLKDVSLELCRGEVLGIAGLVGAGRTELIRLIQGLDAASDGVIEIHGKPAAASVMERWKEGVGMVSENRKEEGLAVNLTLTDNITLSRMHEKTVAGVIAPRRLQKETASQMESLAIKASSPLAAIQSLSGGNQQKAAIGRLLHHGVDILLLDEPTRGIDVGSKAEIYRLIDQLACGDAERGIPGKAVLVVSSYLPELLGICDRIAVMCRGVLGRARPVKEWSEHSIMLEATGAENKS